MNVTDSRTTKSANSAIVKFGELPVGSYFLEFYRKRVYIKIPMYHEINAVGIEYAVAGDLSSFFEDDELVELIDIKITITK